MSCDRALRIELAGFLADPRAEDFRAFRDHYPRCPDCAAEVRAWTELQQLLSAAHPDAETLARYHALDPGARARVDRHAARCASCREELALLAGFEPERLRAAAARPAPPERDGGSRSGWLEAVGRVLWHPGFAYALALLLTLPLIYRSVGPWGERVAAPAFESAARPEAAVPRGERASAPAGEPPEGVYASAPAGEPPEGVYASAPAGEPPGARYTTAPPGETPVLPRDLRADVDEGALQKRAVAQDVARAPEPGRGAAAADAEARMAEARIARKEAAEAAPRERLAVPPSLAEEPPALAEPPRPLPAPSPRSPSVVAKPRRQLMEPEAVAGAAAPPRAAETSASAAPARLGAAPATGAQAATRSAPPATRSAPPATRSVPPATLADAGAAAQQRGSGFAAAPPAAPGPPEVALEPGGLVEVTLPTDAAAIVLRLPVPAAATPGGEAEIRVQSPDGRRELRERLVVPGGAGGRAGPVRLSVPRGWLVAGVQRVELHLRGAPGVEATRYSFRVREP